MNATSIACLFKFLILVLLGSWLSGCTPEIFHRKPELLPPEVEIEAEIEEKAVKETIQTHGFYLNREDSVVGRLARVPIKEGDTLLDIARHFGLGYQHIAEANPDLDIWIPRQGDIAILPLQFILPEAPRKGIVINLAAMRLFYFSTGKNQTLSTWPLGIGREGRSTPMGIMTIVNKKVRPTWYVPESIRRTHQQQGDPLPAVVPPGPDNPLGNYALYLSKPSYLIHGTNKPYSIGLRASNGCIRLYPENIEKAFREIPTKTQVVVVNQPYLLGWRNGVLYLEAHRPFEEIDVKQAKNNLLAKLRRINHKQQYQYDWPKIDEIIKQARGIPSPIFQRTGSLKEQLAAAVLLERPARLFGQPDNLEQARDGWYIKTTEIIDDFKAKRLAAQLNHLGPRIPARVVANNRRYQVIAGPLSNENAARKSQRILAVDFEIRSELVKPKKLMLRK